MTRLIRLLLVWWATWAFACTPLRASDTASSHSAQVEPFSAASELAWITPDIHRSKALLGQELLEIPVFPGEIVRFSTDRPLSFAERIGSGKDVAEVWSHHVPTDGLVFIRVGLFTNAILTKVNSFKEVHVGRAKDPGYLWFHWEDRVVEWSNGPLGEPYPRAASASRIDFKAFEELDRAIASQVNDQSSSALWEAVRALRRVAGLRAIRAIRPIGGYPYGKTRPLLPEPAGSASPQTEAQVRQFGRREFYALTPAQPLEVVTEGPRLLHFEVLADRVSTDSLVSVRVEERERLRGLTSSPIGRMRRQTSSDSEASETESLMETDSGEAPDEGKLPADVARMRRVVVHVPPGRHRYSIRALGGSAWVHPLSVLPSLHVEDALSNRFDETHLLAKGAIACQSPDTKGLCAIYLALAAKDNGDDWEDALTQSSTKVAALARMLSQGGPADPTLKHEIQATSGRDNDLHELELELTQDVDETLRETWWRTGLRTTSWQNMARRTNGPSDWVVMSPDTSDPACLKSPASSVPTPLVKLGSQETVLRATLLRRQNELSLLVRSSCSEQAPVELVVDGEHLVANPSAGQTLWRILVKGTTAKVKVISAPGVEIFAADPGGACAAAMSAMPAPTETSQKAPLVFAPGEGKPGLEVWLREGTRRAKLSVSPTKRSRSSERVSIVLSPGNIRAIAPDGTRWRRTARIPLPDWAMEGFRLSPHPKVRAHAVRRVPRSLRNETTVTELRTEEIIRLSRALLEARTNETKGDLYARRALLLAEAGAGDPALADALAVRKFGGGDQFGKDPVLAIQEAILSLPAEPLQMQVKAYGLGQDFDPGAQRCQPLTNSVRNQVDELQTRLSEGTSDGTYDAELAKYAAEVSLGNPDDPRVPVLVKRAMAGSDWRAVTRLGTANRRVAKPRPPRSADGSVKPWLLAGAPFDSDYVTVSDSRPAEAVVTQLDGANLTVHYVCIPRLPSLASPRGCPLTIGVFGGERQRVRVPKNGTGKVTLNRAFLGSGRKRLTISVDRSPARWAAVVQLAFDKEVPGSREAKPGVWVLETPLVEYRHVVEPAVPLAVRLPVPGVLGVDAVREGATDPEVILTIDGVRHELPLDGVRQVFPITGSGNVRISARGGSATVSLVQRVASPRVLPKDFLARQARGLQSRHNARQKPDCERERCWDSIARDSGLPRPPRALLAGTVTSATGVVMGSLPEDIRAQRRDSTYLEQRLEVRRRFEDLALWLKLGGSVRPRLTGGPPSYAVNSHFYQDGESTRLRFYGSGNVHFQNIDDEGATTIRPQAFIEYLLPPVEGLFILPRLGYDGFYTNFVGRPDSVSDTDDEVWSSYRLSRRSLFYGQILAWWVPFINNIYYARPRLVFNADSTQVDSGRLRLGALLALNQFTSALSAEGVWSNATRAGDSPLSGGAGIGLALHSWPVWRSLHVQPIADAGFRTSGSWQLSFFLNVSLSDEQGLRDFASFEVDFPEQQGGGVPWRGSYQGVNR